MSRNPKIPVGVPEEARICLYPTSLASQDKIEQIFERFKPHAVIHTASPSYMDTKKTLMSKNVDGTKALLEAARTCSDTKAFVFTSSDEAIMPTQEPTSEENAHRYDENNAPNAPNAYALSKALAKRLVIAANSEELYTSVIRIPGIYGKYDDNFIPQLVSSMREKEHKMQVGNNTKVFEFLYVNKAAEAHTMANIEETITAWKTLETYVPHQIRNLGISNIEFPILKELHDAVTVKPSVVQNCFHAGTHFDIELRAYCRRQEIAYQSFWTLNGNPKLAASMPIGMISEKAGVEFVAAYYALLFGLDGVAVIDGTTTESHMKDDLEGIEKVASWAEGTGADEWTRALTEFKQSIGDVRK